MTLSGLRDLSDRTFPTTIINMFKDLKEIVFKELKESIMTMTQKRETEMTKMHKWKV